MKLARFKYGDTINKKLLNNVVNKLILKQGEVLRGIDPMDVEKAATINNIFDAFTETHYFKQLSEGTQGHYLRIYGHYLAEKWGRKSINSIRRADVVAFLNDINKDAIYNQVKTTL